MARDEEFHHLARLGVEREIHDMRHALEIVDRLDIDLDENLERAVAQPILARGQQTVPAHAAQAIDFAALHGELHGWVEG